MNIAHNNRSANGTSEIAGGLDRTPAARADAETSELSRLFWLFRRRLWLIALVTLMTVALGAVYSFTAQPKFTAVTGLLIDNSAASLSRIDPAGSPAAEDLIAIETQMQIILSQRVAVAVVDELDLTNNPLFIPNSTDAITAAMGAIFGIIRRPVTLLAGAFDTGSARRDDGDDLTIDAGMDERERAAILVRKQTSVRRIGASRALEVSYTGNHPEIAAQIANALTAAYVQDRVNSQYEATENAGAWLRERIAELQERSSETARRVHQFRADNNIVESGGGRGLVTQEQLYRVSERLVEAADDTALQRARHEAIQRGIATEGWDTDLSDAGSNELIGMLRENLLDVSSRLVELQARLDPSAPAIAIALEERTRLTEAIRQEMRRVAERLRASYEVAVEREQELKAEFARLVQEANTTSEAQVQLQQLESDAEVLEATYSSYLKRYTEVIQQQSAPFLQARIITPATVPLDPSQPQKSLILALAAILGGGLGMAFAIGAEGFDRTVRLPRQLKRIGLGSLGVIPRAWDRNAALGQWDGKPRKVDTDVWSRIQNALPMRQAHGQVIFDQARTANELSFAADAPTSAFAYSLRRTKIELHLAMASDKGTVIGITSLSRGEGTTTIASNLARLFAISGKQTRLIDANSHNPTISESMRPEDLDGLAGGARNFQMMRIDELHTRLRDPSENDPTFALSASDLFGNRRMGELAKDTRSRFDCTILDLPAIESVPDVLAAAPHLDMLLIVVEWGRTPGDALQDATDNLRHHGARVVGAVLNKVDLRQIRLQGHREADTGYARAV